MTPIRSVYRVLRSILFTVIATVFGVVALLYVLLSVPSVTDRIRTEAEKNLTELFGGKVTIESASIFPFNEVRLHDVAIYTPHGQKCITMQRLGAGIDLGTLLIDEKIEITYVELIGLDARIEQKRKDTPFNIQFIVDALKSKDEKSPSKVEITLHNIVIRKSRIALQRPYLPSAPAAQLDISNLCLDNFNADLALPYICDNNIRAYVRRIAFNERCGLQVKSLEFKAVISPEKIGISDFSLKVGSSHFKLNDQEVEMNGFNDLVNALKTTSRSVQLSASPFYISDFASLYAPLAELDMRTGLDINLQGSLSDFSIEEVAFRTTEPGFGLFLEADVKGADSPKSLSAVINRLECNVNYTMASHMAHLLPEKVLEIFQRAGSVALEASGRVNLEESNAQLTTAIETAAGSVDASASLSWNDRGFTARDFIVNAMNLNAGHLAGIDQFGLLSLNAEGNIFLDRGLLQGDIGLEIPFVDFRGNRIENISLQAEKIASEISGILTVKDEICDVDCTAGITLDGINSVWNADVQVNRFMPGMTGLGKFSRDQNITGNLYASITGDRPVNMEGELALTAFALEGGKTPLALDRLTVYSDIRDEYRTFHVDSDLLSADINGRYDPLDLAAMVTGLVHEVLPIYVSAPHEVDTSGQYADIDITINPSDEFFELLKTPVRPGVPVTVSGHIDGDKWLADLDLEAPYLIKGKDKLIKKTELHATLSKSVPAKVTAATSFPMKNDRAEAVVDITGRDNLFNASLGWKMESNPMNNGNIAFEVSLGREPLSNSLTAEARMHDSGFAINREAWKISPAIISYNDKSVNIENLNISNGSQFLRISGRASDNPLDVITARLAGIDLDYLFNILNINYVDFGGHATGKALASSLFSGAPVARTDGLFVKDLAYNGCVVGDGQLESHWDNDAKMVAINADIQAADTAFTTVRGGIYVTRDSLDLNFTADKTDVGLLKPFMSGFTSSVKGKASGRIKVYGTFDDVDLDGRVFADTITMKVDYTNVYYSGSDSVFFDKGLISIPHIRLYDKYGNSGVMKGYVRHNYLHDASFRFEIRDAEKMLAYNTDGSSGFPWYGKVFASGDVTITGRPGLVALNIDMTTDKGSDFTIALDRTQQAAVYNFLTFSNRRQPVLQIEEEDNFEKRFERKRQEEVAALKGLFTLDMSLGVTPDVNMCLIMDPATGDKIRAYGNGAFQMHYDSDSDDFSIYGKYVLDKGNYNFSLQDLILKNFTIQPGSSISFNGNPMEGILNITAAYRVNTNLTDLDASFRDDPDLKRTSVPVDALLKVNDDIDSPEIKFDIALPTVTAEVERRLRSLISTEEMLNQQVIYLLALNRFYTPDYSGGERGGELASVASSTISSQIQNIIGSVTDKFQLAPSIKSDKSDLSDMEFDVALSSRLFDDRLLINGNLGYRDKSTSQTTFVGDFDIEYLLNRKGYLRLKAYNHFNDASYYLKSALTTQGIGIVYRRDFDDAFLFLKRRKKKNLK